MEAAVIDTLRYARRLRDAGVVPEQAEAMAEALSDEFVQNLVTKADLNAAKADLNAAIAGLRSDMATNMAALEANMAALEARLTWRLLGGVTVIVGLAVALGELG